MESFKIKPDDLSNLFTQEEIRTGKSLGKLNAMNGISGLCDMLQTSTREGISTDSAEIRTSYFGDNKAQEYHGKSIWHFICANLADTVLQILIGAAAISLIIGLVQDPSKGWLEGTAILVAVVIVVAVSAVNDYMKEKQFIKLNLETDTHKVVVTRDARQVEISAYEVLVGDLVFIGPGEILPVDGILVKGSGLKVDESSITGESSLVKKDALRAGDFDVNPFLISGSKINDGSGYVICCNVGKHSVLGKNRMMTDQVEDDLETPLQERLVVIAEALGKLGFIAGGLLAVVLVAHTTIDGISNSEWGEDEWSEIIQAFILGITILVVAIPEGLPLALTLSMAYSILRMKKENIFVRHLKGCEIMGAATNILSDKTGTLTQNRMATAKVLMCGKDVGVNGWLSDKEKYLIAEGIARNSTASLTEDKDGKQVMIGNKTELALLQMIHQWNIGYELFRNQDAQITQFAFSSSLKRMTTVYDLGEKGMAVYSKGAGEIILQKCTHKYTNGFKQELTPEDREEFKRQIIDMASNCLRIIGLAYKITSQQGLGELTQEEVEQEMIFLGFVGIKDPLRPESAGCVVKCQNAGVKVRMLTGDSVETAVRIAKESNILPGDIPDEDLGDYVMEGSEIRERSGGLMVNYDENGKIESFDIRDQFAFDSMMEKLTVVARCTPEDKLLLVVGLKKSGEVVGVTGDGSNDAAALKQSDIGLAMMSGTPLAKENSDIILLDDNFESVVNSIKWGRNVYASIRKFLQFQVTVNIVALIVSIVGALTVKDSPLTAVQMLWVNLIMDSMAALALATEPPTDDVFNTTPFGRTETIITKDMYINIATQSSYQVICLLVLLYLGPTIFDIEEGWGNDDWNEDNGLHFTLFFQAFVVLQICNEINCRKLRMEEWNFFSQFFNNWMFLGILVVTFVVQVSLVELGGEALKCSGLSIWYHMLCISIGAGGLGFSLAIRMAVCAVRRKNKQFESEESKKLLN